MGMTETDASATWRIFDTVEIDMAGRRLFVNGVEASLEPKAFDALLLLVERAGRVCPREDLLDTVWGHRHITPGVLSRVINLLRQALGEDGDEPRYLHTIHGIGYRFDAKVRAASQPRLRDRDPNIKTEVPLLDAHRTFGDVAVAAPIPSNATVDRKATSPAPSSRLPHATLLLLPLLAALAFAGWKLWPWHSPTAAAGISPALVVLPLHAIGGSQNEREFAAGLSEELITYLSHIDGLRLISSASAAYAQEQKFEPTQLAARLNVSHALEGSLRQSEQRLRIDLRLIDTANGRTIWAENYDRNQVDIFAIQREIAQSVAAALRLKLRFPSTSTDGDPALLRDYLELRQALLYPRKGAPSNEDIAERLRQLIAQAPDDARLRGLYARAIAPELMTPVIEVPTKLAAEITAHAQHALERDPGQIDATIALGALACNAARWKECLDRYRHVLTLVPAEARLRAIYAGHLRNLGYLEDAEREGRIAYADDPLNLAMVWVRAFTLSSLGRHKDAKAVLDAAAAEWPDYYWLKIARWNNAAWRGDFAAAHGIAASLPEAEDYREAFTAVTDALVDPALWPQAHIAIDRADRPNGANRFVRLLDPQLDPIIAAGLLEQIFRERNQKVGYATYLWMPETARFRHGSEFNALLTRYRILDYWHEAGFPPQCRPEGDDGARCD